MGQNFDPTVQIGQGQQANTDRFREINGQFAQGGNILGLQSFKELLIDTSRQRQSGSQCTKEADMAEVDAAGREIGEAQRTSQQMDDFMIGFDISVAIKFCADL